MLAYLEADLSVQADGFWLGSPADVGASGCADRVLNVLVDRCSEAKIWQELMCSVEYEMPHRARLAVP